MAEQQDPLRSVYNDLGLEKAGVGFDKFKTKFMSDSNARRSVYSDLGLEQAGVDYDTYETRLGVQKKKETSQPDLASGAEISGEPSATSQVEETTIVSSTEPIPETGSVEEPPVFNNAAEAGQRFVGGIETYSIPVDPQNIRLEEDMRNAARGHQRLLVDIPSSNDPITGIERVAEFEIPEGTQVINPRLTQDESTYSLQYIDAEGNRQNALEIVTVTPTSAQMRKRELESIPFDQWTNEERIDYGLANIVQSNAESGFVAEDDVRDARIADEASRDAEDDSFWGNVYDHTSRAVGSFGRGATRLASATLGIPEYLYDAVNNITNTNTFREKYGDTFLQEAQRYLDGAISRDELYDSIRFGDSGVVDAFDDGDIGRGISNLVSATTESLPIMLGLASGNTAALATTLSMGAGQYNQLQEQNPEMDNSMKLLNATLNMYAEAIPERIGASAVFSPFYSLYKKQGREVAENALAQYFRRYAGQFGAISPTVVEASTEIATAGLQNLIAKHTGEDPDRKFTDGMLEAGIIGGFAGGAISSPATISNSIVNTKNRKEAERLSVENADIEATLQDESVPQEVKSALTERYLKNTEVINGYIEGEIEAKDRLSPRQENIVSDLENRKIRMQAILENESVPDSVKESTQAEVDAINNEIESIITTVNEPTERVKREGVTEITDAVIEARPELANYKGKFFEDVDGSVRVYETEYQVAPSSDVSVEQIDQSVMSQREASPDVENVPMGEMIVTDTVFDTLDRINTNERVGEAEIDSATEVLYEKKKELKSLLNDPNRSHTSEEINTAIEGIDTDIEALTEYKGPSIQGQDFSVINPGDVFAEGEVKSTSITEDGSIDVTLTDDTVLNSKEYAAKEPIEASTEAIEETPITPSETAVESTSELVTETPIEAIVEETEATEGQYFTRDIGGEPTLYRRNEDGTTSIVPEAEAQQILSRQEGVARPVDTDTTPDAQPRPQKAQSEKPDLIDRPKNIKEAREKAEAVLKSYGLDYSFTGQSDSNGLSVYFDVDGRKVRFSDHSISNRDRMENESTFNFGDDVESVEQSVLGLRYDLGDTNVEYGKFRTWKRKSDGKEFLVAGYREKSNDTNKNKETTTPENEQTPVQSEAVQETTEVAPEATEVAPRAKAPSLKEVLTSDEARQSRLTELRDRINKYRSDPQNLGISKDSKKNAQYWRDITDYAAIRIVDGAISTARQLARELGISESPQLNKAFSDAKKIVSEDVEVQMTTARNIDTARKRAEFGFDERLPVVRQSVAEVESRARQLIEEGVDVGAIIDKAVSGMPISEVETSILAQYTAAKEASVLALNEQIEKGVEGSNRTFGALSTQRDIDMNDLLVAYTALEQSGTVLARALNIRKSLVSRDLSLAGMIVDMRKARGNAPLSDTEVQEIQKRYKEMADLADNIRRRNEQLETENARLNALLATDRMQQEINEAKRKAKTTKPRKEAVADIRDHREKVLLPEFKKALQTMFNPGFAWTPENQSNVDKSLAKATYELVKSYIQEFTATGRKYTANEVIDRLFAEISEVAPNVTREQVMNLIDSSNPERRQSRSELSTELRNFRTELRLIREIERLEAGGDIRERLRNNPTQRNITLDELRKKLKNLRENIRNQNNPDDGTKPPVNESDDYNLEKQRKSLEKRIAEYDRRIKEKDYAPERKQLVLDDPQLKDLRRSLGRMKFRYQVDVRKAELERRGLTGKAMDVVREAVSIPRTLLATGDMSALFRQMMFTVASRPILTARTAARMVQFWASKKSYENYFDDFRASEGYDLALKSGLSLTDVADNVGAAAREEMYMSNVINKASKYIPVLGGLHLRAERSFTGSINKMRIDLFQRGVELLEREGKFVDTHKKAYQDLATYVNAATGRGPMPGELGNVGSTLSSIFFAPRLVTSRVYLLTLGPLWNTNNVVRKMYLRDLVSFISFGLSVAGAAVALGADVDDDPTSVDFGMIRVGDRRYDIWGGISQYARFVARIVSGKMTSSTGRVTELNSSDWGSMSRLDLLGRFGRSKLAPTTSLLFSALDGQNYMGEAFDWQQELINMSYPLVIQDIKEAWVDQNEGVKSLYTVGAPAFFGIGVQTWRANEFLAQGVDDKLIDLTNDKKVATMMPTENRIKLHDIDSGEDRKPTSSEFKRYVEIWSDYIKKDLESNYDKYKSMSSDKFGDEFDNIKSKASKHAKERITGMSQHDRTFTQGGKTYTLTPEQLRQRIEYNKEYIRDEDWRVYDKSDALEDNGMSRDMALIEARKWLESKAREYSKQRILEEFEDSLVEKE